MSFPPPSEASRGREPFPMLRSAAFRLTILYGVLFVLCLLALDLVFGLTARLWIEQEARRTVEERLAPFTDAMSADEALALLKQMRAQGALESMEYGV
ncbi:MAG: hypothetical protein MRY63_05070 [Neomegalonema sp.]|nr:hypothetical protein [Neomegalonema sp.]